MISIQPPVKVDKQAILRMLRKSLLPSHVDIDYGRKQQAKWINDRLTTLAIYSHSDKAQCNPLYINCLRLFSKGWNYLSIASEMGLKKDTVRVYVYKALNWVVENTPDYLLINIPCEHTQWKLKGCPKCKGDLMWDDGEGQYCCMACARRYD